MWPFNKKKTTLEKSGLLQGLTDHHSHLLPGVDDGVETLEESLAILGAMEGQGTGEVWLTPHIMEDIPNETAALQQRFDELKSAYTGTIRLHLAAEYMLDNLFGERLAAGDLLPIGERKDKLLVETSFFNPPYNLHATLEKIRQKGYHPVLAHPERYLYMSETDYRDLKSKGILFQLNLFSLSGSYGKEVQRKAEWLLKHRFIDLMGTDTHRLPQYERGIAGKIASSVLQLTRVGSSSR